MSISAIGSGHFFYSKSINISGINDSNVQGPYSSGSASIDDSTGFYKQNLHPNAEQSEKELQQKAYLSYLDKYIRSYGAPEELDRNKCEKIEITTEDEKEKLKKKAKQNFNTDAFETSSKTIQDPEKEDKVKVIVSKANEDGDVKITRIMTFGPKNGKNEKEEQTKQDTRSKGEHKTKMTITADSFSTVTNDERT